MKTLIVVIAALAVLTGGFGVRVQTNGADDNLGRSFCYLFYFIALVLGVVDLLIFGIWALVKL